VNLAGIVENSGEAQKDNIYNAPPPSNCQRFLTAGFLNPSNVIDGLGFLPGRFFPWQMRMRLQL
jgi:hypothetical protein